MRGARTLFIVGVASLGLAATEASAQSLFGFPLGMPGSSGPPPNPQTFLPPDADPNYSTPGGFDDEVALNQTGALGDGDDSCQRRGFVFGRDFVLGHFAVEILFNGGETTI